MNSRPNLASSTDTEPSLGYRLSAVITAQGERSMKPLMSLLVLLSTAAIAADAPPKPASVSKSYVSPGGSVLRPLTEPQSFGGTEVEVGELTFPPNSDSGDHQHGVTETFYVLVGELE